MSSCPDVGDTADVVVVDDMANSSKNNTKRRCSSLSIPGWGVRQKDRGRRRRTANGEMKEKGYALVVMRQE